MKNEETTLHRFDSLTEAHRSLGFPIPKHPLISFLNNSQAQVVMRALPPTHVLKFYKIAYKPKLGGKLKYGQGYYDFDEGGLMFAAPNQVIGANMDDEPGVCSQYTVLIHPDFLLGHSLAKKIKQYGFFSYSTREALHLSEDEKQMVISIFNMIESELNSRIDDFSQDVVISQLELLLHYANRFYKRQFITRKGVSSDLLLKLEDLLEQYFNDEATLREGLPTVHYLAEHLNVTPGYLSDMLRSLTGSNTQQLIHNKLIEKAKEQLSTTRLTVGEVAFSLGFEHSQSFSKLFKTKTGFSPLEFRRSFN